jgi:hypothetical protein
MTTSSETRMGRLKFKRQYRFDLIDTSERMIEHHKSMIRNYKDQIKAFNREIDAEIRKGT